MTFGLAFWVLMLIWFVFGIWIDFADRNRLGGHLLLFILFLILGWHAFGAPIHG